MTARIAIVGASGFIGSRAVEWFHLGEVAEVRPVVRSLNRLARLSRFDLDCRVADALDAAALQGAFDGCDAVVHAVAGDPATVTATIEPVYRAAQRAGVTRLIYLSSASVHGQAPPSGTTESSPLRADQPVAYNNAKVRAERHLMRLRKSGPMEVVILRPGIVTGPRSYWISSFATDLLAGKACTVRHGQGVCNSIYVDNLIHAIDLAITTPAADGHAFLVGDRETVTWADLYGPVAEALGMELGSLPDLAYRARSRTWLERLEALGNRPGVRAVAERLPKQLRRILYAAVASPAPRSPWSRPAPVRDELEVSLEMSLLQQCRFKLPNDKAKRILGYEPPVSFADGCRRTVGWMAFAGYPVTTLFSARPRRPNVTQLQQQIDGSCSIDSP